MKALVILVAFMMIIVTSEARKRCKTKLKAAEGELEELKAQACRFDFEDGLQGWEKTGTAFDNQPTYGDNPMARNRGQPAHQEGDWWIGGAENRPSKESPAGKMQGDEPVGTLTSPSFKITGKFISFLIGGGGVRGDCGGFAPVDVRAELIIDGQAVRNATGSCYETMVNVSWNVSEFVGKEAQVKLIDNSSGGWGHINFDDLRGDISCAQD